MSCTPGGFISATDAHLIAKTNVVVWHEICAIQQAVLTAIENSATNTGEFCTTIAGNTPFTFVEEISSISIVAPGQDYFPVVATVAFTNDASGTGATGTVNVGATGIITSIDITAGGTGYDTGTTTVDITHPNGTGFAGTITETAGVIDGVTITDGGINYGDLLPTVAFVDPSGLGQEAAAVLTVGGIGELTTVTLTNPGEFYSQSTVANVIEAPTSSGADGTLAITVTSNTFNTTPFDYYLQVTGTSSDNTIKVQITEVINYFRNLGYDIVAQVNPDTNQTIQWKVCWI